MSATPWPSASPRSSSRSHRTAGATCPGSSAGYCGSPGPAGLIVAATTFSAYALARARGLPLTEQRTAATLVTLILSLCVLALLAMPLTWRRIALLIAALGAAALTGFWVLSRRQGRGPAEMARE